MVGREIGSAYYRTDFGQPVSDETVLSVRNVTVNGELEDVSFDLHKGEILGFGGNLLLTVAFGHAGGFLQGLEGLVVLGLVDLLLGDGNHGLGNDLLALGDHVSGLVRGTGLELGEGALELGQSLDLVGLQGLGAHVEGFHSGAHVLSGSDSSGECERRDGDK